jgi:hypothetical protein
MQYFKDRSESFDYYILVLLKEGQSTTCIQLDKVIRLFT